MSHVNGLPKTNRDDTKDIRDRSNLMLEKSLGFANFGLRLRWYSLILGNTPPAVAVVKWI